MKLKIGLVDSKPTTSQQMIIFGWYMLIAGVVGLWILGSSELLSVGLSEALLSIGRLLGLLATFFALTQFMLMGRVAWIEQSFGLDRLANFHRFNGYMAITLILLHPVFIVTSYSIASGQNYIEQYISTVRDTPFVWLALISQILFVLVVGSSIYIARKRMKFETWYYVHLMVYGAIILVPFHQFVSSPELAGSVFGMYFWLALYGFVALNILIWRFGLLIFNYFRFDFRVVDVVAETATTTSVYIKARNVSRLKIKPGQFVLVRILAPRLFLQEHPFSVSSMPSDDVFRLTIRKVGDYTTDIVSLKPGARVVVAGPFGRFTKDVAVTSKRLFVAGGVGITPIRSMVEEASKLGIDSVLLYALRTPDDAPLKKELDELSKSSNYLKVLYVYSDVPSNYKGIHGRLDGSMIEALVPDFKKRDIYICGPPTMMVSLVSDLRTSNLSSGQLHYELFSLHS